jgi:ribonuclease-3
LGFTPKNLAIYQLALRHRSSNSNQSDKLYNNERLEFLGDSVLNTVVSDIIYHEYPNLREGALTTLRSKMVQRTTLDQLAVDLGLHTLIKINEKQFPTKEGHINGNAFEALVGAIYIDGGYNKCKECLLRLIKNKYLDMHKLSQADINFKSKFIEWTQRRKVSYHFKHTQANQHRFPSDYNYIADVYVESIVAGQGTGNSKKEAEQNACKVALSTIKKKTFKAKLAKIKPDASIQNQKASSNS